MFTLVILLCLPKITLQNNRIVRISNVQPLTGIGMVRFSNGPSNHITFGFYLDFYHPNTGHSGLVFKWLIEIQSENAQKGINQILVSGIQMFQPFECCQTGSWISYQSKF